MEVPMKRIGLILALGLLAACSSDPKAQCGKDNCATDPNCQCWCSVKCGYRDKTKDDHPVWIENDPNGKGCYCKQWDHDHYEDNCVKGMKLKEPAGAQ